MKLQNLGPELLAVSAGNYGGKLGKFHFHLHKVLTKVLTPTASG
jgi:hypothetical protein